MGAVKEARGENKGTGDVWVSAGPMFFYISVSGRPGGSEGAGGREKTKTGKHRGPGRAGGRDDPCGPARERYLG